MTAYIERGWQCKNCLHWQQYQDPDLIQRRQGFWVDSHWGRCAWLSADVSDSFVIIEQEDVDTYETFGCAAWATR